MLYIGTYTQTGSEGIYILALDPGTGALRLSATAPDPHNPSYLILDSRGRHLYAVNELGDGDAAVATYAVDPVTGALALIGRQVSGGGHPCHLAIAGNHLLVTNYSEGTVTSLPILADGALGPVVSVAQHQGSGPTERQAGPHPHSAVQVDRFIYVPDLGLDSILIYRLESGELVPVAEAVLAPGSGPRHLAVRSDGRILYVANELGSTVTVLERDEVTGRLEAVQTLSTVPPGFEGRNYPADLHLHPSGRFLYLSNRGHDSLALYQVDGQSGRLTAAGHFPAEGRWPRSFAIDPGGRFLVAAHQKSDSIVSLAIDQATGALAPTGHALQIPSPACVRFA